MPNTVLKSLQVAVGVIKNADGNILIALREPGAHQGGLWEFPGGKLEAGETAAKALVRELKEELNVSVHSAIPLLTINHHYPDLQVQLLVFLVEQFSGTPNSSASGQPFRWVPVPQLTEFAFPEANKPIITALSLPDRYAILDDTDKQPLLPKLQRLLAKNITLIQARLKQSTALEVAEFIAKARPLCQQHQAMLLMNSAVVNAEQWPVHGVHLTAKDLLALKHRPAGAGWLAASCHNLPELQHAQQLGVDFVVLAPVQATATHPETSAMGWERFAEFAASVNMPVYALGGLANADLPTAKLAGAQGVAGIRCFLQE